MKVKFNPRVSTITYTADYGGKMVSISSLHD